jgi:hypothetical protein
VPGAVYDICKADIGPVVHAETDAAKMLFRAPHIPSDAVKTFTRMPQVMTTLAAQRLVAAARSDKTRGAAALKNYPAALVALGQQFNDLGKALPNGASSPRSLRTILATVIGRALQVNRLARAMGIQACAAGPTGPV